MNPDSIKHLRFIALLGSTHFLAILSLILVLVYVIHFGGGFAFRDDPSKEFNFHPFFMILGFIFFNTHAVLIYRTVPHVPKPKLKLVHLTLQITALIIIILALVAIFDSHNAKNMPHMYSLHSWVGMGTVVLFCLQLLFGAVSFFYPKTPQSVRVTYLPIHVFFGSAIFVLAVVSCLLGIMRYAGFDKSYSNFSSSGMVANCLGLVLILLATCVIYLLVNTEYKRLPRPEDEQVLKE